MSEAEAKTSMRTEASLSPANKNAVIMGAAATIGFGAGWGLSMAINPDARSYLSMIGLVVGATVGWLIGRLGKKPAA